MKIAFFSNMRGRSGVTTNLSLYAACASVESAYDSDILMIENHFSLHNIAGCFENINCLLSGNFVNKNSSISSYKPVLNHFTNNTCLNSIVVINQNLRYYQNAPLCTQDKRDEMFMHILKECEKSVSYPDGDIYIDTSVGRCGSTKKILKDADIVVVNLSQNLKQLEHFFENYSCIRDKAFFVIGNYVKDSFVSRERICSLFKIENSRMAVVPQLMEFDAAMQQGELLSFVLNHLPCQEGTESAIFMKEVWNGIKKLQQMKKQVQQKRHLETLCFQASEQLLRKQKRIGLTDAKI